MPENIIKYEDIIDAYKRIKKYIYKTPLEHSRFLSEKNDYYLKLESQQKVNSFKIRGALSKLTKITDQEKEKGIMAVSSGNHGAAVSYASSLLGGIKTVIFVPEGTPKAKVEKIKYYGAEVKIIGEDYNATHKIATNFKAEHELTMIDPCSDKEVIAGQGTIGLEIMKQLPEVKSILVPVGGGGLITGISVAVKKFNPDVQIIGLQTEACPAMIQSIRDNKFYEEYPIDTSICDALVGGVGEIPFEMANICIDEMIKVKESSIRKAVPIIMEEEKVMVEPSSAIGYAAILENPAFAKLVKADKTAIIISGGNIDGTTLRELLCDNSLT